MAITVSNGLKTAAVNSAGSVPVALLEIYPVSGAISTSKGLRRRIYDGYYPLAGTGTSILNEGTFSDPATGNPSHADWDVTNDWDDTGGNAEYTWSANQTSTVQQIAGDRASTGENAVTYTLFYTVAVTTAPDGDFALTLENFSGASVPLPYIAGPQAVKFVSAANATNQPFTIQTTCTTGTEGQFSIDNLSCSTLENALWDDTSSNLICFNYGSAPPLGITPSMLSDNQTWSIRWDGYIRCSHPSGVTGDISWSLGYVATGYVVVATGANAIDEDSGTVQGSGSSPHSISDLGEILTYGGSEDVWWPVTIWYSRSNASNRVFADERFTFFIKDSRDEEWQILGSDRTCPLGGRFKNLVNTPVTAVDAPLQSVAASTYTLNIHVVGGAYHFHKSTDTTTEYPLTPGQSVQYTLEGAGSQHGFITITWAESISNGDMVEVQLIAKDEPAWEIPVTDMAVETSIEGASTLRFTVPVTEVAFDEEDVDRTNFSTYDLDTDSFGVIRPNRMVRASFGYMVDGLPEYVTRFTGLIQDIEPSHDVDTDGTPDITLDVTCIDSRVLGNEPPITKIDDMILGAIPNELSYDIAQRFPESTGLQGGDGQVRPPAFDGWNLATVVRTVLYQSGFNATQLWAKDANGNFLIDDRSVYLETTPAYPFSIISELGASTEVDTIQQRVYSPDKDRSRAWPLDKIAMLGAAGFILGNIYEEVQEQAATRTVEHWTEHAASKDMAYLYMFDLDLAPWTAVKNLCDTYGLVLGVNNEGNVYMRYPNNPVLYSAVTRTTMPLLSYDGGWAETGLASAMSNEILWTITAGQITITFEGVGIDLILTRLNSTSKLTLEVDGVVVDGVGELDSTTGDKGHTDWTDNVVMPGSYVDLKYDDLASGVSHWYYQDGVHPDFGKNPTVFTICDNLTYGTHTLVIRWVEGLVYLEGFGVLTISTEQPQHEFDATTDLLGVELNATLASSANDIIIAGNMRGAVGDYVFARAVDMASIYDENSPNYIGVRKPWYIADPRINNQERADFLAQDLLLRSRRGDRKPVVQSPGLPWLEGGDPVTIRDMHEVADGSFIPTIGLYSPGDLTKAQRTGTSGVLPVPFQRYWVTDTSGRFTMESDSPKYVSTVTTSASPPLPAYEPLPEPAQSESSTPITEPYISYDAGGVNYNPFTADDSGEYVNIEFDLNWHARVLNVAIVVLSNAITLPSGEKMLRGHLVNVLYAKTGFIPAGRYLFRWDGWMEGEGGGLLAPDGWYAVSVATERYSTGAAFTARPESGYPTVRSGSKNYISIVQDRDAVYGATPFSVVLTPNAAPSSPPLLYDLETNSGQGLQIAVTLACPAQIVIPIMVRFVNVDTVPANDPADVFFDEKWVMYLRGDDTPIMEPGTYTFYFNPGTDVTKDGRFALPFGAGRIASGRNVPAVRNRSAATQAQMAGQWHIGWHFQLASGIICRDKAGTQTFVHPSNPTWEHYNWGGPRAATYTKAERDDQYVTWSFLDVKSAI